MHPIILQLAGLLDQKITDENQERGLDGLPPLPFLEITVLGQFALFLHPDLSEKLHLQATVDFDAWVTPSWLSRRIFHESIAQLGLHYDSLSHEIWIPQDASRRTLYESELLKIETFDPLDILVSKAVKAANKNRYLLIHALSHFGEPLIARLRSYKVDIEGLLNEPVHEPINKPKKN